MVKYLDILSKEDAVGLNIPTGIPLAYELNENLKSLNSHYLGDPEAVQKAAVAVTKQAGVEESPYKPVLHAPPTPNPSRDADGVGFAQRS